MRVGSALEIYEPSGIADGLVAWILRRALRLLLRPVFSPKRSIPFQRRWLHALTRFAPLPRGIEVVRDSMGGVPGEWLRQRGVAPAKAGVLLYLHGGAYCLGSPATHRALTARLALATGLPVFAADYRLAPEHPFPAALNDALGTYRALQTQGPVVLAGDSAGGGLALSVALAIRDAHLPPPAALYLISPWVDLSPEGGVARVPRGEVMLSAAWAGDCARHYAGPAPAVTAIIDSGQNRLEQPEISPLRARLGGLPPTLIQAGTDEMLYGQATELHAALQAAGVVARCEITAHRWHVFQMHGGILRSADEAIGRSARFLMGPIAAAATPAHSHHAVVILGAGMSGLCMAIGLQRAGIRDFVILEQQDGLGGTWWDNTYPGAHVDVPAPLYSFSFEANPDWSDRFASASEIQAYMQKVAERHRLLGRIRLATRITAADFDASTARWHFTTARGDTFEAPFFVCSAGPLNQPRWPDIPGLQDFQGTRLHSARWDSSCNLAARRVAVIGTGSTACQLVAPLAREARQLYVFQRTANWVMPRLDRRYTALDRLLAKFPPYAALVRWIWMQTLELMRRGFDEGTWVRRGLLTLAASHLKRQVPQASLRAKLTPNYPLGCKRIIYSNDFFPSFSLPNVELVTEPIERITAYGIVTADGCDRPIDVLVCATGFDVGHMLSSVRVRGLQGRSLREAWNQGPEAYHGISVPGFPNLFLLLGPNTGTGHTSTLLFIEAQVRYAIACIRAVRSGHHRWIDVRAQAFREHNDRLQTRLSGSVWSHCRSWYRLDNGRVIALFPGYTREYVRALHRPNLGDFELV